MYWAVFVPIIQLIVEMIWLVSGNNCIDNGSIFCGSSERPWFDHSCVESHIEGNSGGGGWVGGSSGLVVRAQSALHATLELLHDSTSVQ